MKTLVKTSIKLLFRTKAFWFFLILAPVLSTFILKIKFDSSAAYMKNVNEEIIELKDPDEKVVYHGNNGEYLVKVYDASGSELSDYFLRKLAHTGFFTICRADITNKKAEGERLVSSYTEQDGFEDRMGVSIYISPDFDKCIMDGDIKNAMTINVLSDDERYEALEHEITFQISRIRSFGADGSEKTLVQMDENLPHKEIVRLASVNGRELSKTQINQKTQVGYSFAFLTLGFVFCGIFVAHNAIREQRNGVLTRINLTGATTVKYFASKFITVFIVSFMVTSVMALCSLFLKTEDLGMNKVRFIGMIFLMGLIFSSLSMLLGILLGDVMSANVSAFTIWSMSSLLSGVYFPLDYTSKALKALSFAMPQKWFLDGTEMIFVGDNKVYLMLLCITAAYLAVILSLGSLGMKIKRVDQWGNS